MEQSAFEPDTLQAIARRYRDDGLSQRAIARKLGVSYDRVRGWFDPGRRVHNRHGFISLRARPFIAYDGEGVGDRYMFLADSRGNKLVDPRAAYGREARRLSTEKCLKFLTAAPSAKVHRIWFSFGYDVNHIVRDLPDRDLDLLFRGEPVSWRGWKLHHIPDKMLTITTPGGAKVVHADVFTFFKGSFIETVRKFLGDDQADDPILQEGKAARGDFSEWTIDKIDAYNAVELRQLVDVAGELREYCYHEQLPFELGPRIFYGPGSIANIVLDKIGARREGKRYDRPIRRNAILNDIFARAYFGGRVELLKLGRFQNVSWYDLRSAYPSALLELPICGYRFRRIRELVPGAFAVYRVRWQLHDPQLPGPFPWRDDKGYIYFPARGEGWYWAPEVEAAISHLGERVQILDGLAMETDRGAAAFSRFVPRIYDLRQQLVAAHDPAEYVLKVALNSMYGKLCNRNGPHKEKLGRFFCLPWAGWVTSSTRAKLYDLSMRAPGSVIGFATDAIFATEPLPAIEGKQLGQWESSQIDDSYFFSPGVYATKRKAWELHRRGFGSEFELDDLLDQLDGDDKAIVKTKIFVGHALAIAQPNAYGHKRLRFVEIEKVINPTKIRKRTFNFAPLVANWRSGSASSVMIPGFFGLSKPAFIFGDDDPQGRLELVGERQAREF